MIISAANPAMRNSTVAKTRCLGTRSATAPAKRARRFRDIRAAEIAPTKKGESVMVRTNHPMTNISIWVPIATNVVDDQTNRKLRCWKTEKA